MSKLINKTDKKFIYESGKKAFDLNHRKILKHNISIYDRAVLRGKEIFDNIDLLKERARAIKLKVINNLDNYLINFQDNFEKRGGKVLWAEDSEVAVKKIIKILKEYDAKHVIKSKSMVSEEIELNRSLEEEGIEVLETDLGEYIVQIAGEKPYHIITPAIHKSKEDIAELFNEKFGVSRESTPEELTDFVRQLLREKFVNADVGITGCNFLIADVGGIAITENEGNGLMSFSFPKVHIVVTGIEKIIPSLMDLDTFWPLLAVHGTGQNMTVYNSVLMGPKKKEEQDGPDEIYLVLLDNNRTEILNHEKQRIALSCIRCGACLNACPVYKNIGGHTYGTTYSGPIGSVISPHILGMEEYKHLSFASSLCGRCFEVCPVNIPLHELLLHNRNESVEKGYVDRKEKLMMFGIKKVMLNSKLMNFGGGKMKNYVLQKFLSKAWGPNRTLPEIKERSFRKQWKKRKRNL